MEKITTNPPIINIVLIDVSILFDNNSPKLLKDREELGKAQSVFLWYFSFDFPHHLNIKPTVKQLNRCVTKRIRPMEKL